MDNKICTVLIGDQNYCFSENNLPLLIHYICKTGGSHYSMVLIANLVLQGSKALILTGYSAAKEEFYQETKALVKNIAIVHTLTDIKENKDKQIIIIHDDDEKLCLQAIKTFEDIEERIIFIKNIDIFHTPLITECLKHTKLILSGDLDLCEAKEDILKKEYVSLILFSQPQIALSHTFIPGEKYNGYIRSKNTEGYTKIAG